MGRFAFAMLFGAVALFSAEAAAIGPENLRAAVDYSKGRRGLAVLVIEKGAVMCEEYQNGSSSGAKHKIYSGTKAFWVMAALAAVQEGLLRLDEHVADTVPEWQGDSRKERITVRQLLQCASGLDEAPWLHRRGLADRNGSALQLSAVAEPGRAFIYGPSHYQVFGEVLRRKLAKRGETPTAYLERRVLRPLGLSAGDYLRDGRGQPLLATGFELTARQWARLGEMILNHGSYNGVQIVPASLLGECFRGSGANPAFGPGFWLNVNARSFGAREPDIEDMLQRKWWQQDWSGLCLCRDAPADLVVSLGSGYQRLYIIPSRNLIIVRQGLDAKFSDADFLRCLLR